MKRRTFLSTLFLSAVLVLLYVPIVTVVVYSFNQNTAKNAAEFTGFSLQWYEQLFSSTRGYFPALLTSLRVAAASVILAVVIGTMGAVGAARKAIGAPKKTARLFGALVEPMATLPIMIPEIIMGMSLMAVFSMAGLPFGELTLVLAHTTFCVPYVYLVVKSNLSGMDDAVFEAARDLGATPRRVLFTITLPLVRPAVVSGAFLALAMSLDDFVISFFVNGAGAVTLPLKIYSSVKVGVSPQINALCTVMLVTVFLFVALSRSAGSLRSRAERRAARRQRAART